jgi:hypothetical protein
MSISRLIAIVFILACVTIAWFILGTSIVVRTDPEGLNATLYRQVENLWGSPHVQKAPVVAVQAQDGSAPNVPLESSEIDVDLHLKHRRKGLLWYATYTVDFDANYTFSNPTDQPLTATVTFEFPASSPSWDNFEFRVQDVHATPSGDTGNTLAATVELAPNEEADIHIGYESRGMDRWAYSFADSVTSVKNFRLTINTDFDGFDFPEGTISPSKKQAHAVGRGWELVWESSNLVSAFDVGISMPTKINPGPMASRMSFFAPVSLLFFFTVLVVLSAVKKDTSLHPMHYFFLGASFFSFHLLFAYLVDHIQLEISFAISAAVSLLLVVSYLGRVTGWRFALREAGISQFLFLILFSYAFFFEGYTGLVVTIGAILTLAALMQITAKVDWSEVFRKPKKTPFAPDTPPSNPPTAPAN